MIESENQECWCGMDHTKMDMDSDGNWIEFPDEDEEEEDKS